MDDHRQWRLRADLCRKVAGQTRDHWAADCLRSMADEYQAHATALEAGDDPFPDDREADRPAAGDRKLGH